MASRAYTQIAILLEQEDHPIQQVMPDGTRFTIPRQNRIPDYGVAILRGLEELLREEEDDDPENLWLHATPEGSVA